MDAALVYLAPGAVLAIACLIEGRTPIPTLLATLLLGPILVPLIAVMELRRTNWL